MCLTVRNEQRAQVIGYLVEGTSIRATVRITRVAKNTVVKLLADLGKACADYQNDASHAGHLCDGLNGRIQLITDTLNLYLTVVDSSIA